jgi:glycosidase
LSDLAQILFNKTIIKIITKSKHKAMKKTILFFICTILAFSLKGQTNSPENSSPQWIKDLIIYEISTKNFTSPNGPGTGTFNSLKKKIPYLDELGINGVWLTGHNWADEDHFYNIWTQYASIRPDSIDPSLGTPEDFKELNQTFEKHDIKVFLDVITHGVMNNSPLIDQHPEWFEGGSWGMTDYDWDGNHPELEEWWIQTHVNYVLDYGVDGYRLDVGIFRPDLWKEIKQRCAEAGHPIAVYLESPHEHEGACNFYQRMTTLSRQRVNLDTTHPLLKNVGRYFQSRANGHLFYEVTVVYKDSSEAKGYSYSTKGELGVEILYHPDVMSYSERKKKNDLKNVQMAISNIDTSKYINKVSIHPRDIWNFWNYQSSSPRNITIRSGSTVEVSFEPYIPERHYYSVQLSSHDDGWDGFPASNNPYVAEGSRCVFGYSCLFTPAIPLFMSGEEFNAEFRPNPDLAPGLFGKGDPGSGTWLYGAVIDWNQLEQPKHQQMLEDVKEMINIRKQESDIFHAYQSGNPLNIKPLQYDAKGDGDIPVPYMLWNKEKIIMVAGNKNNRDVKYTVNIPAETIWKDTYEKYKITDLWNNEQKKVDSGTLKNYNLHIKRDKVPKGGIAILKIEPVK